MVVGGRVVRRGVRRVGFLPRYLIVYFGTGEQTVGDRKCSNGPAFLQFKTIRPRFPRRLISAVRRARNRGISRLVYRARKFGFDGRNGVIVVYHRPVSCDVITLIVAAKTKK